MKPRPALPPGPYLVVGLARSGVAAALALRARGEEVMGCDAGARDDPLLSAAAGRLRDAGVEVQLDGSGDDLAARAGTLIKSPGVPHSAPPVLAARLFADAYRRYRGLRTTALRYFCVYGPRQDYRRTIPPAAISAAPASG